MANESAAPDVTLVVFRQGDFHTVLLSGNPARVRAFAVGDRPGLERGVFVPLTEREERQAARLMHEAMNPAPAPEASHRVGCLCPACHLARVAP
jgi:hypothetical protein